MSKSLHKKGLSNLISALLLIIILVNSIVVLQKYTNYSTGVIEEEVRSNIPTNLETIRLSNGTVLVYNNEDRIIRIRYIIYSNSSYKKTDFQINPKSNILLNESDVTALITDDSHVIIVPKKPIPILSNELYQSCIPLKRDLQVGIGDGYLSKVFQYVVYPAINSIVLRKYADYSLDNYLQVDLSKINSLRFDVAYIKRNSTFITSNFHGFNNETLIINVTKAGFETSYKKNYVYDFNSSKYLEDVKEIDLIPILGSVVLDDENATVTYHIHYSSLISRLYLYVNGELYDTISSGNYFSMGSTFNVTIKRIGIHQLLFLLKARNANYNRIIPYSSNTVLSLGTGVKIGSIEINTTIKLYPSIVIVPPPLDTEFALQLNGTTPIYANVRNVFQYYSMHIYPSYISLITRGFRLKGNGSLVYSNELNKPLILFYSYKNNYHFTVTHGPFLGVIGLAYNGYSRYLNYFVIPYVSNDSPVLEIVKDTVSKLLFTKAFSNNNSICTCSISTIFLQKLYTHSTENEALAVYNYMPIIGNLLLNYPQALSGGDNIVILPVRYLNLSDTKSLRLVQYKAINGSIEEAKLCFNSNYRGYIVIRGYPYSMVYLVKPSEIVPQGVNGVIIGDNYIVAKIPANGTVAMPFTTLSQTTP
ncbi:MAG: hypothetical protein F7B60_06520 [Desulfurococcales archaeon]|nr:hypothetical protein [Desulfurococcales archaeon]